MSLSLSSRKSYKLESQPRSISVSQDGLALVTCQKHLYLFSLKDLASACTPIATRDQLPAEPTTGAISADGRLAAIGLGVSFPGHDSTQCKLQLIRVVVFA